ncbi:hypothetical protein LOD99_11756 [Oopsacas minuta]|uniref:Uncharacterized protein n=1 Tax=Oopsacas minuta TaxID=111878 RepID=A0AAV7JLS9_9METZ|nr:hypothetical protein LOD99_11756 [Oopsacas minuta]
MAENLDAIDKEFMKNDPYEDLSDVSDSVFISEEKYTKSETQIEDVISEDMSQQDEPTIEKSLPNTLQQDEPTIEKSLPNTLQQDEPAIEKSLPNTLQQDEPTIEKSLPNTPQQDEPTIEKSLPNTPQQGEPTIEKSLPNTPQQGEPTIEKSLQNTPQQDEPTIEKSLPNTLQQDEPTIEKSLPNTPQQDEPTIEKSLQNTPQDKLRSNTLPNTLQQDEPTIQKSLQNTLQVKPRSNTIRNTLQQDEPTRKMSFQNILEQNQSTRRESLTYLSKQDEERKQFVKNLSKQSKETREMILDSMAQDNLTKIFRKDMFQDEDTRKKFMGDMSRRAKSDRKTFNYSMSEQDDATRNKFLQNISKYEATRKMFYRDIKEDEVTRKEFLKVMSELDNTQSLLIKYILQQDEATRHIFMEDLSKFDIRGLYLKAILQQDESTRIMFLNDLSRQDPATRNVFLVDIFDDEATRYMFINDMSRRAEDIIFYENVSRIDHNSRKMVFINKTKFELTRRKLNSDLVQDKDMKKCYIGDKKLFDKTRKMLGKRARTDMSTNEFIKDMTKFEATRKRYIQKMSNLPDEENLFETMLQQDENNLEVFLNVISRQDKEIRIKFTKDTAQQDKATRKLFEEMVNEAEICRKMFLKVTVKVEASCVKFIECLSRQDETSRKMLIKQLSLQDNLPNQFLNALSKHDEETLGMFLKDLTQQVPASRRKYFKAMSEDETMLKKYITCMSEYESTQKMFRKEMSLLHPAARTNFKDALLALDKEIQDKFPRDLSILDPNSPDFLNYPFIEGSKAQGIIIVNKEFKGKKRRRNEDIPKERVGAEKEREYLQEIYDKFDIDYKDNDYFDVEGEAIEKKLQHFSDNVSDESPVIFISLASHGGSKGILGTDGRGIQMTDIVKIFTDNEKLLGIPKVFLIQACRENAKDVVYETEDNKAIKKGKHVTTKISDVLIAYATSNGTIAFRDEEGSWFFRELRKCVLNESYKNRHFQELLTICSDQLIDECVEEETKSVTETPSYDSTLRKFLLFPQKQSQD